MIPGCIGAIVPPFHLEAELARRRLDVRHDFTAFRRWQRASSRAFGPAASIRAIHEGAAIPLLALFGTASTSAPGVALLRGSHGPLAVASVGWNERPAGASRAAAAAAIASGARWAAVFNGTHLRIVDPLRVYAASCLEFDLAVASTNPTTFAALEIVVGAAVSRGTRPGPTALDDLAAAAGEASVDVCRALRSGVLDASRLVASALVSPHSRDPGTVLEQALTIVYRVLFLLFAEARGLVPMWHPVYRASYSIESLRVAADRPAAPPGLWDALRAISRLAHAGCTLGELRVAPFNGRLFAPARTPLVERPDLDDRYARQAIVALTTAEQAGRRRPVPYRDLGVEQLGAVYETLLDYEPRLYRSGGRLSVALDRGSGRRKATGAFYTPQSIAEYVVRRTLGPLVGDRDADAILQLRVLDPAMGSGAFLVAACRFLAEACERALIARGHRAAADIDDAERAALRRLVAERCLYGVDVNPTAVQLARLSLWLATLAADRPLTFLDHHLAAGNSLIGASVSALRRPPPWHRRRVATGGPTLFELERLHADALTALPIRFQLASGPDDTLDQVRAKERALDALARPDTPLGRWKAVGDAWCAPWFVPGRGGAVAAAFHALSDGYLTGASRLPAASTETLRAAVAAAAASRRFFHWELEFPEAFFTAAGARDPNGGFDAVIGNPPWEMVRADTGTADDRRGSRADAEAIVRFTRDSGLYDSPPRGHPNQYQMFVDRAIALTKRGGRLGLIVPAGLALDSGSASLRRHLFSTCAVDAIVGFHNQHAIFPVHRSVRFLIVTAQRGAPTTSIDCRFGERDARVLDTVDDHPSGIQLSAGALARISSADLAVPELRAATDLRIVERAAVLFPPLGSRAGWAARFGRELNASDDRSAFDDRRGSLPVVEGKHVEPFRVSLAAARHRIAAAAARRLLPARTFERPRLCYRDVAGATNRLTLIAAILPAGVVSTHTLFCLRTEMREDDQQFLCGLFNSFVVNYLVRLRVGTHVTTGIVEALPVPTRERAAAFGVIAAMARRLGRADDPAARARLNAEAAALYELRVEEYRHVLDTFPLVPGAEREAALAAYTAAEPQRR